MKKIFLALLLCGMAVVSKADGDIINEDFSEGFDSVKNDIKTRQVLGWTIFGCELLQGGYPKSLKFACYESSEKYSYAISPAFGDNITTTKVVLTFRYANTAVDKNSTFSVTLNSGGEFEGNTVVKDFTITTKSGKFNEASLKIFGVTPATTLTFRLTSKNKNYFALDDVKVTSVSKMSLSESAENNIIPQTADVELERTLQGEIWNTFCLPFDVDTTILKRALGEKQNIQLRTFAGYENNVIKFSKAERVEAGTPFLIKLNNKVENPVFECVDVKETQAQTVTYGDVSFVGVYSQTELPADDGNVYMFLTANGALVKPTGSNRTLKGMRAYFSVPAAKIATARIAIDGDGTTSVHDVPSPVMVDDAWYTLSGVRYAQQPAKGGLYVKNGKKVVLK